MKKIIIIRHSKSSWSEVGLADFDRPLSERGENDADLMSKKLLKKASKIDLLISSSSKRTRLTSNYFINQINIKSVRYIDELYHASSDEIFNILVNIDKSINSLILVGHNPGLTNFINNLTHLNLYNLPTSGIVILSFINDEWNMKKLEKNQLNVEWIKFPKDFKL